VCQQVSAIAEHIAYQISAGLRILTGGQMLLAWTANRAPS
jgi:hypothetical protein